MTNNVTHTAMASSDPTLSLPQSSSTLPNLSHNDTYGIEESDTHHNSRGDIAE